MKPVRAIRCLTFAATLAAAVLLPAAVVSAAVYVADAQSPAASDDNPGSEAKPFKTIAAAVKVAKAGDTVCVMAGDYAERVKLTASGAAGQPLVLKSLPPHAATMRGFDTGGQSYLRIEGFHVVSDNPADRTPGIALTGAGQGIEVVSNFVEGMYMGIEGGGSDVRIACNKVYKTQFGMLSNSGGKGWLIERNGIERQFQHRAGDCDYSRMWGQEHLIRHNRYYATQRSEVGKAHLDCVQSFNVKKDNPGMFLHHLTFEGNVCDSFSQVFMLSTSTPGTHHHFTFKGNIMYNSGSWGFCVKTIPDCTAVNNTFAGIKWYGFGNAGAERGRANYNLYASINTPYTTGPGFEGKGNLVFDCENPPKEPAAGEMIQGDPKFVDAAKGNFRLTAGSAAIDAGPDGLDIGALEYPNVYYVDAEHPGADDEGFGYVGWPFKTVAKACSVAQAGETIMLRGGTYRETIKPQADGVTIRAMADETVTVSGADLVTEWKRDGEVWAAAMETAPAKLLVDGKPSESVAYDAAAKRVVARSMDPRLHTVEAVVRERAVDLTGRKDVRVDGLNCADTLGEPVAK